MHRDSAMEEDYEENESPQNQVSYLKKALQNGFDKCRRRVIDIQKWIEENKLRLLKLGALSIDLQDECDAKIKERSRLQAANEKLKVTDLSSSSKISKILQDQISEMESKLRDLEEREKKIYKNIMELKGTIRVFCRVRPLLLVDGVGTEGTIISYPTSMEARHRGIDLVQSGQKHSFTFDRVFDDKALQKDVFEEISDLVRNALDGHKVCIFAYGQTGSGKTYTMMGGPKPEDKGLIPHSLEHIFKTSHESEKLGWEYKMQASMLEIYNETIRDLLSTNPSYALDMFWSRGKGHVSAITTVDVCNIEEILSLLQQATRNRFVGSTKMNERSSRSHFVFSLKIFGENKINEQQVQGVLNVIDLAGSQRVSSTLAIGDRLKETQAINRSLSALAAVISALAKKKKHVPYRNSKLTYILEPYLSGDSKVLMFVNISPNPSSGGESLCSLRFAAKVNACEIGIPRVRVDNRRIFYL